MKAMVHKSTTTNRIDADPRVVAVGNLVLPCGNRIEAFGDQRVVAAGSAR